MDPEKLIARNKDFALLWQHWWDIRKSNDAPKREDLNPRVLKSILPRILILDTRNTTKSVDFRLIGTEASNQHESDTTGQNVFSMLSADVSLQLQIAIAGCISYRCALYFVYENVHEDGTINLEEALYLPLADMKDNPTQAIGIVTAVDQNFLYLHGPIVERVTRCLHFDFLDLGKGVPKRNDNLPFDPNF